MNRFDTYQPIKFDVPMFTPDFAALEALQTQKQKTLDDFRNQTDLIASSIKDDPYDPTVKEKKIKDIMASKDAIVNEMLRNPTKGSQLLNQYQSTLKNDILFGDINKVNARATDYESKIADLKTQPLWNDPIWRKGALEEIKNSYGDFQTTEGFGKTKGDDFAHTFYTVAEIDAIKSSYVDKLAHDQFDEDVKLRPDLWTPDSYDRWFSQKKVDKLGYDKLLAAALPQAMADKRLQDYYETEGKFRGLGAGQGELTTIIDKNGNRVISDATLFGKSLHGSLTERVVDNSSTNYIQRSADKLKMKDEEAFRIADREDQQRFQAAQQAKAIQAQKDAAELAYNRDLDLKAKVLEAEKKKKQEEGISTEESPIQTTKFTPGEIVELRKENVTKLRDLQKRVSDINKLTVNNPNYFIENPKIYKEWSDLQTKITLAQGNVARYEKQINDIANNSEFVSKVFKNDEVNYADVFGGKNASTIYKNIKTGQILQSDNYIDKKALGDMSDSELKKYGYEKKYQSVNNDYSADHLQEIAQSKGIDLQKEMMQAMSMGQDWKSFKQSSTYKKMVGSGGDNFGIGNSMYDVYNTAKEMFDNGTWGKSYAEQIQPALLAPAMDSPKGKVYYEAGFNGMNNGTIKDVNGLTIHETIANKTGEKPEDITLVKSPGKENHSTYKINGGTPESGYYHVYYTIKGDKTVYDHDGFADNDYSKISAFQDVHNTYELGAVDDKGTWKDNAAADDIIAARIQHNPSMRVDVAGIKNLKVGQRFELNSSINTPNGIILLDRNNFNVVKLGNGNYEVNYKTSDGTDKNFVDEYSSPTAAYSAIYKYVTNPN